MDATKLPWSDKFEPNKKIPYNHVTLETPLGLCTIEWKEWKISSMFTSYCDGNYISNDCTLEEAKIAILNHLKNITDKLNNLLGYEKV